jgi:hypothetical protein
MSWLDDVHSERLRREQAEREKVAAQEAKERASSARSLAADPRVVANRQVEAYAVSLDHMVRGSLTDMARLSWGEGKFEFVQHATDERSPQKPTFVDDNGAVMTIVDGSSTSSAMPRWASWTVRGPLASSHVSSPLNGRTGRSYTYPYYRICVEFGETGAPTALQYEGGEPSPGPVTEDMLHEQLKAYYLAGPSMGKWTRQ